MADAALTLCVRGKEQVMQGAEAGERVHFIYAENELIMANHKVY